MHNGDIFIFSSKIFPFKSKRDVISELPLEIVWKIFSYLDGKSLQTVTYASPIWRRIIYCKKQLRDKLDRYNFSSRQSCKHVVDLQMKWLRKYRKKKRGTDFTEIPFRFDVREQNILKPGKKRKLDTNDDKNDVIKRKRIF